MTKIPGGWCSEVVFCQTFCRVWFGHPPDAGSPWWAYRAYVCVQPWLHGSWGQLKILNACTYWDWDLDQDELEEEEMQFRYNRGRLAPGTDAWLRLVWLEGEHGELMFPWLP